MAERTRHGQFDQNDEPHLGGERPVIVPEAIADHFRSELQNAGKLTHRVLETEITDVGGNKQIINPMRVRPIKPHRDREGNFHFKHKGIVFTVTGAALLSAAAGIRIRQKRSK